MSDTLKTTVRSAARWGLDLEAVLRLSASVEEATSPLDAPALEALLLDACHVGEVGAGEDAFLIAFDETAAYDGVNYRWFRARLTRFVYIDRVAVAAHCRGRGLARRLYGELAAWARAEGHTVLVCEVNLVPPNPVSDAFHAALGFHEVGRGEPSPGKIVRYLQWDLP